MSDDRETPASRAAETPEPNGAPGAPVEETEASQTEVMRAVRRSQQPADGETTPQAGDEAAPAGEAGTEAESAAGSDADAAAPVTDAADTGVAPDPEGAEAARRQAISEVDTQLNLEKPGADEAAQRLESLDALPTAAATPAAERDGEIRISPDHPMAALYTQSPIPPDLKGNRGAGVLIALLGTIGFAIVYAGALALWLAPIFPPSRYLSDGLLPWLTSWPIIATTAAFFVALAIVVLIVGRAGWWAYVLGGFLVAAFVWAVSTVALAYFGTPYETPQEMIGGALGGFGNWQEIVHRFGLSAPALAAALVAREVTVWFGAWIGARGRRMKAKNAAALAEYEEALADVQAKRA